MDVAILEDKNGNVIYSNVTFLRIPTTGELLHAGAWRPVIKVAHYWVAGQPKVIVMVGDAVAQPGLESTKLEVSSPA